MALQEESGKAARFSSISDSTGAKAMQIYVSIIRSD
jgi:hypothetical protein